MALKQHKDDKVRFDQQVENARSYVLPFIEATHKVAGGVNVLEIGCGEGGVLKPFADKGCYCVGVDLNQVRIDLAHKFLEKEVSEKKMEFMYKNVYDEDFFQRFHDFFDIIILKDTIEHIPEQEKFIPFLKKFLRPGGQIFFGFPPWYMPFGGHQQLCESRLLSKLAYYHILPRFIYLGLLKLAGEPEGVWRDLMEVRDTRITIERFERIVNNSGFKVLKKQHYLINPIYKYKFGLQAPQAVGTDNALVFPKEFPDYLCVYTIG